MDHHYCSSEGAQRHARTHTHAYIHLLCSFSPAAEIPIRTLHRKAPSSSSSSSSSWSLPLFGFLLCSCSRSFHPQVTHYSLTIFIKQRRSVFTLIFKAKSMSQLPAADIHDSSRSVCVCVCVCACVCQQASAVKTTSLKFFCPLRVLSKNKRW